MLFDVCNLGYEVPANYKLTNCVKFNLRLFWVGRHSVLMVCIVYATQNSRCFKSCFRSHIGTNLKAFDLFSSYEVQLLAISNIS